MAGYAVLLRGINVGGSRKVSMADLRLVLETLGYTDVRTYLQSGNAVVDAGRKRPATVAREVEKALADELGMDIAVLVRTHSELTAVVEANPFPEAVEKPNLLHVAFLSEQPKPAEVAGLDPDRYAPDRFAFGADRALYLWYATGAGRSKMDATGAFKIGGVVTARNWNTVRKLVDLTAD